MGIMPYFCLMTHHVYVYIVIIIHIDIKQAPYTVATLECRIFLYQIL